MYGNTPYIVSPVYYRVYPTPTPPPPPKKGAGAGT